MDHVLDVLVTECRVEHLALLAMDIPFSEQDTMSDDLPQKTDKVAGLRVLVRVGAKDVLNSLGVGQKDASVVEETTIADNSAVLFDPLTMRDAGFFFNDVGKVAEEGEVVLVVFGLVGWTGDVAEGGEEVG